MRRYSSQVTRTPPESTASWVLADTSGEAREDLMESRPAMEAESQRLAQMVGPMAQAEFIAAHIERAAAAMPRMKKKKSRMKE